ncbi:MAG: Hvo_1808 family surface protein, partial [Halovenus sp.]
MKRLVLVVVVVALAGCGSSVPGGPGSVQEDGIGEVNGVTSDSDLDIDPSDGFTEAELEQLVNRSMARIEVVRDLNYKRPVNVTIVNRSEYREQYVDRVTGPTHPEWENQIWRGLFIVGQDRNATDVLDEAFGGAVQGFYEPGQNSIVIVSDSETPTVRKQTLIHELTHALQDQQFGLAFGQETRDQQAAYDTLIEGEAELVSKLYLDRCGDEWSCVRPDVDTSQAGDLDRGIAQIITQPYRQGIGFVEQ